MGPVSGAKPRAGTKRSIWVFAGLLGAAACRVAAPVEPPPPDDARRPILSAEYGSHVAHPEALGPGEALAQAELELAEGGRFVLDDAAAVGPVILVWIGGAEGQALTAWVRELAAALAEFDARGVTLAFVRPLEPEAALRWAAQLGLQVPVLADFEGALWERLGLEAAQGVLDQALIVVDDGVITYRKYGGRRPELAELLAVVDGRGAELRCCAETGCADPPCRSDALE